MSAPPTCQRQGLSLYHFSPHLKEESEGSLEEEQWSHWHLRGWVCGSKGVIMISWHIREWESDSRPLLQPFTHVLQTAWVKQWRCQQDVYYIAVKHVNTLACMLYSGYPCTTQEMFAQPIVLRQMMSQYHLSPHLKEEGGRVSGGGAVGAD